MDTEVRLVKHEKSCGAIVYKFEKDGQPKILLVKHRYGGHWAFPKGHVEAGESEVETAHREIWEETGLKVRLQEGFRESGEYSPKPNVMKEVIYFLGEVVSGTEHRQEKEISELKWLSIEEAERQVTHDNNRKLIEDAKRFLIKT